MDAWHVLRSYRHRTFCSNGLTITDNWEEHGTELELAHTHTVPLAGVEVVRGPHAQWFRPDRSNAHLFLGGKVAHTLYQQPCFVPSQHGCRKTGIQPPRHRCGSHTATVAAQVHPVGILRTEVQCGQHHTQCPE